METTLKYVSWVFPKPDCLLFSDWPCTDGLAAVAHLDL